MNRAALLVPLLAVTLTGCGVTANSTESEPAQAAPTTDCLPVSKLATFSIQRHLNAVAPDQTILDIAAVPGPNSDGWFVAARVDSQGDHVTATWFTANDPTIDEDNAYISVDAMAATISDYLRPDGASSAMEGAQQAQACLS